MSSRQRRRHDADQRLEQFHAGRGVGGDAALAPQLLDFCLELGGRMGGLAGVHLRILHLRTRVPTLLP